MRSILTGLVIVLFSLSAMAEQKQVFGDTEVHYMILNSKELNANVAESYGIQRSSKLGFLMVSVLDAQASNDVPVAIPALIKARVVNLIGQVNNIELEEIREQGGLYYVGTFSFYNEDIYRFEFDVKTSSEQASPYQVRHQQRMFFE